MRVRWVLALLALPLAACGSDPEPATPTDTSTENAAATTTSDPTVSTATMKDGAQPAKLAQCTTCHTFEEGGVVRLGPNLWGIYGKPAASNSDFAYSTALRNSGLVWDDISLDAYLADPRKSVPNGKMNFVGLKNPKDRTEIIEYLSTLKPAE